MQAKIKDRVGILAHVDREEIHLVGFGVYVADEAPGPGMDEMPKLVLDTGEVIFGCGHFIWGPEAVIDKMIAAYRQGGADLKVGVLPTHSALSAGSN